MQRRKFIAGMGSLAAGGAAAMGTGAFTSVSANRSVSVQMADDADAFLAIRPEDSENANEYAEVSSNGTVMLDFGKDDINEDTGISGEAASGLNKNATSIFDNLLTIQNQGTQGVYVGYTAPGSIGAKKLTNAGFYLYHEDPTYTAQSESNYDASAGNYNNGGQLNIDTASDNDSDNNPDLVYLEPGQSLTHIGAAFFGNPDVTTIQSTPVVFKAADEFADL
ncbi:MAG: hypothetical protein ABEJ78_01085 [Haloferacaceae archaeon]